MKETLTFEADNAGIGDICILAWLAEGYRKQGIKVQFHSTRDRQGILETLSQPATDAATPPALNMCQSPKEDAPLLGYHYELRVTRGAISRTLAWPKSLGKPCLPQRPTLTIPQANRDEANEIVRKWFENDPFVVLAPFVSWHPREWPIAYWIDYAQILKERGVKTVVIGTNSEEHAKKMRDMPGGNWLAGYGWATLGALFQRACFFVGNDSGPAHFAGCCGLPGFALCGPTKNLYNVYGCIEEVHAEKEDAPCVGCYFHKDKGYRAACNHECRALLAVTPETLAERTFKQLKFLCPTMT